MPKRSPPRGARAAGRSHPETVLDAVRFVVDAHGRQLRKDGRTPYLVHPVGVLRVLSTELGVTDPDLLRGGLLHDVVEDTSCTSDTLRRAFGPAVARLVDELTLPPELHGPHVPDSAKSRALVHAVRTISWPAVVVKLADRIDNLRDTANARWTAGKRRRFRDQTRQVLEAVTQRARREPPPRRLAAPLARGRRLVLAELRRTARAHRRPRASSVGRRGTRP